MAIRRKRLLLGGCIATVALLVLLTIFRRDIGTAYVAWRLDAAQTSDAELNAASLMNRSAHTWTYGYTVETEDPQGNAIRPWETGDYNAVATVIVTWDDGTTVRRDVINRDSLSYVFGE
jgi:hypothetical protein